jgi:chemotaxis protein methyltransferase CheR
LRYSDENYRLAGGAHSLLDYFDERDGAMAVNAAIRRNIVWAEYGLATGQSFNEFNLIVCRNIVRGLTPTLQRRAYKLFTESLPIFGLLALGIDEMPNISPYIYCYKEWDREAGLHQRVC